MTPVTVKVKVPRLRVLGELVTDMDVRASAERVGYVFQDPENQIVCETVWHEMAFGLENLGLARDEMRRRVAETSYFFGLEDWLHRDTDTLSGGRKQNEFPREASVIERNLDKLGAKGWELVSVYGLPNDPIYYLKRKRNAE